MEQRRYLGRGGRVRKAQLQRDGAFLGLELTISQNPFPDSSCGIARHQQRFSFVEASVKPRLANSPAGFWDRTEEKLEVVFLTNNMFWNRSWYLTFQNKSPSSQQPPYSLVMQLGEAIGILLCNHLLSYTHYLYAKWHQRKKNLILWTPFEITQIINVWK